MMAYGPVSITLWPCAVLPSAVEVGTIYGMKSLLKSNPYLADPASRRAMVRHNARQSSLFEGARGISAQPRRISRKHRSRASTKKAVKAS
jgi:hypothetical protein